jgi:hypothetical protein
MHLWPIFLEVFLSIVCISSERMESSAGLLYRFAVGIWSEKCDFISKIDKMASDKPQRLDMAVDWMRPNHDEGRLVERHIKLACAIVIEKKFTLQVVGEMKSSFYTRISRQMIYTTAWISRVLGPGPRCLKHLGTDYRVTLISAKEYIEVEDVLALDTDYVELSSTNGRNKDPAVWS